MFFSVIFSRWAELTFFVIFWLLSHFFAAKKVLQKTTGVYEPYNPFLPYSIFINGHSPQTPLALFHPVAPN